MAMHGNSVIQLRLCHGPHLEGHWFNQILDIYAALMGGVNFLFCYVMHINLMCHFST